MAMLNDIVKGILRFFIRTSSFVRKEIYEILRQTRLVLTLILGPFLILLLFGIGYRSDARTLETLVVVPEGSSLEGQVQEYQDLLGPQINIVGTTQDADEADRHLRQQQVDLVIVAPADPMTSVRNSEQATFRFYHNEIDPFEVSYINVVGRVYVDELNRRTLQGVAEEGKIEAASVQDTLDVAQESAETMRQALERGDVTAAQQEQQNLGEQLDLLSLTVGTSLAVLTDVQNDLGSEEINPVVQTVAELQQELELLGSLDPSQSDFTDEVETVTEIEQGLARLDELLTEFRNIDSGVLVSPFRSNVLSIAEVVLDPVDFFTPAVIALLLQHVAVTIAGLSLIRERSAGTMELFRVSPISAFETLLGKYLSFFLLSAVLAAVLTALVLLLIQVPMLGNWVNYSLIIVALLFTSLGVGFIISLVARTDSQAVQYAMIVLLASVFFSGLFLSLERLWQPVRLVSWLIPATYGTSLLHDVMLRGQIADLPIHVYLVAMGIIMFFIAWLLLRREMAYDE
jgi:ABC-2 type transport system permease protein